ncbi:MAG: hypothetical protein IJA97_00930 [Clostridia bacterium]|nr:hypothetical protein [Clostridia bacterium]
MNKFIKSLSLILVIFALCFTFTACKTEVPQNIDDAVSLMQDNGYTVNLLTSDVLPEGAISGFTARSEDGLNGMLALWFNSEEEAEAYVDGWIDDRYSIREFNGLCVYGGTEKAVEIFKS